MVSHYYSTVSAGRTHIAKDENYVGNVNSYNNGFTKFFARIFCKAMKVTIDGQVRWVNIKSYIKLLTNLGVADVTKKTVKNFKVFNTLDIHFAAGDRMRDRLTADKVHNLTIKLIENLYQGNNRGAMQAVGEGADVNRFFWDRQGLRYSFNSYKPNYAGSARQYTATSYTPLLLSAAKNANTVLNFIRRVDGNMNEKGKVVQFVRSIEDVKVNHHLNFGVGAAPAFVRHRGRMHYAGTRFVPTVNVDTNVNTVYRDTAVQTHSTGINLVNGTYQTLQLANPVLLEDHSWVHTRRA